MFELILAGMCIIGAIMNVKRNKWGFVVWIVANCGWIIVNINIGLWEQIPIWAVYNIISIYGFVAWHKEEKI